jgi:hypothetical protein
MEGLEQRAVTLTKLFPPSLIMLVKIAHHHQFVKSKVSSTSMLNCSQLFFALNPLPPDFFLG